MVSESGKAHQVHPSPKRDNSQKMGIRQMISRITEIATLTFAAPIAWKNTGVIRENTAEKKAVILHWCCLLYTSDAADD